MRNSDVRDGWLRDELIFALSIGGTQDEAVFIQNEDRSVLVGDYSTFYRDRLLTFPRSFHTFDMEKKVKESLYIHGNSYCGVPLNNYKFVESHESYEVQLSDVIIGFISRLINFCNENTEDYLINFRRNLGKSEGDVLDIAEEIIIRSNDICEGYFSNIVPQSCMGHYGNIFHK